METGKILPKFNFSEKNWRILRETLETGKLSVTSMKDPSPEWSKKLEEEFARKFHAKHALSFNSCTSSIHSALAALKIGQGNETIVSPTTCYSSILPIMALGSVPIFCDIDENTLTINPKCARKAITDDTKAILLPYVYGLPAETRKIRKICDSNELALIEDCAHVPGMKINGRLAGSFGDIACYSFAESKVLDCGEGGIAITNNKELAEEMRFFKEGGKRAFRVYSPKGANYRMTAFNAFLALNQLKKLQKTITTKESIFKKYAQGIPKYIYAANKRSNVKSVALFKSRNAREIIKELSKAGLKTKGIYRPLNEANIFQNRNLLLEALTNDKNLKKFEQDSNPTPKANKAFQELFYFETDVQKTIGYHKQAAEKFHELIR